MKEPTQKYKSCQDNNWPPSQFVSPLPICFPPEAPNLYIMFYRFRSRWADTHPLMTVFSVLIYRRRGRGSGVDAAAG